MRIDFQAQQVHPKFGQKVSLPPAILKFLVEHASTPHNPSVDEEPFQAFWVEKPDGFLSPYYSLVENVTPRAPTIRRKLCFTRSGKILGAAAYERRTQNHYDGRRHFPNYETHSWTSTVAIQETLEKTKQRILGFFRKGGSLSSQLLKSVRTEELLARVDKVQKSNPVHRLALEIRELRYLPASKAAERSTEPKALLSTEIKTQRTKLAVATPKVRGSSGGRRKGLPKKPSEILSNPKLITVGGVPLKHSKALSTFLANRSKGQSNEEAGEKYEQARAKPAAV